MKTSTSLIKVKMQSVFNLQTLTGVIIGGFLIVLTNTPNIALASKVKEASSTQLIQGSKITEVINASNPETKTADSQRQNTDWQLTLVLLGFLGFGSTFLAMVIIRNWYCSSQKTPDDLSDQPISESKRSNSNKKVRPSIKPNSTSNQLITEMETDAPEIEGIVSLNNSYHSYQHDNEYSNTSDCSNSHNSNSHDSSSNYGSSYDSSSSSDSGSSCDSGSSW